MDFFSGTASTGRRENSGGWHGLWTRGLGLFLPPALQLCVPVCLCTVVAWVYGFLCDHLCGPSIVCVVYVMCIRASSVHRLNVAGCGGSITCLDLSVSGRRE